MAKRRSQAEWAELVVRFEASGKTAEAFAEGTGVNPKTLKWWRSQLKAGSLYRKRQSGEPAPKVTVKRAPKRRVARKPKPLPQLTERLVDRIAAEPGMSVQALALSLRFGERVIRRELTELERLGILVRRGDGPATRWFLG
ncbi:MAG: hypothetical protein R3F61_35740 [Myxococcota bacterium]